jgi:chromosome transmission fidelity protein 18
LQVLLLCGPPGLGKTTLAHIVARHAGYVPMEINASDDRSAEALAARVRNAVEMRSVFGDGKPNCVIIDEIDGAMAGSEGRSAIGALLQVIEGKLARRGKKRGSTAMATASSSSSVPSGGGGEEDDDGDAEAGGEGEVAGSSSGSGGGGGSGGLRRPIICICNDQYVPALRPLRQVARVHVFSQPSRSALLARLRFICREEKMAVRRACSAALFASKPSCSHCGRLCRRTCTR